MLDCQLQLSAATFLQHRPHPIDGNKTWLACKQPWQAQQLNPSAAMLAEALQKGIKLSTLLKNLDPAHHYWVLTWLFNGWQQQWFDANWQLSSEPYPQSIEVIIPVYQNAEGLLKCLAALQQQDFPLQQLRVSIVDDGSPSPISLANTQFPFAWRLLRLRHNMGPGAARNVAAMLPWHSVSSHSPSLQWASSQWTSPQAAPPQWFPSQWTQLALSEHCTAEVQCVAQHAHASPEETASASCILAFIDSDCQPTTHWLSTLNSLLATPWLAAVGTAVHGMHQHTLLERYESHCCSLHKGVQPAVVGGWKDRIAYLAACNLAVRREAFTAIQGFCPTQRFGEDVDLCWRLHKTGHVLFYWPTGGVAHAHRRKLMTFMPQKFAYATSEGWLQQQHPNRFASGHPTTILFIGVLFIALFFIYLILMGIGLSSDTLSNLAALSDFTVFDNFSMSPNSPVPSWFVVAVIAFGLLGAGLLIKKQSAIRQLRRSVDIPMPASLALTLTLRDCIGMLLQSCQLLNRRYGLLLGLVCIGALCVWLVINLGMALLIAGGAVLLIASGMVAEWQQKRHMSPAHFPSVWVFAWGYLCECAAYSAGYWKGQCAIYLKKLCKPSAK